MTSSPDPRQEKLRAVEATLTALEAQLRDLLGELRPSSAQPPAIVSRPVQPGAIVPPRAPPAGPSTARSAPPREIDWSNLLGARALAWAGGVVTVLGIVFFFVLAANRGWLLPEIRLLLGAATSIAVFAAGFWVRSRYGSLHAAVAAAGAGIAGAYATLLAATALYEFVPQGWALVSAAAIAAAGAVTALAWSSETVAGLGLIGAILVPLMVVVPDGEVSFVGTAFVAVMLAGTAAVAMRAGWRDILLIAGGASLVQIAGLTAQTDGMSWRVLWLGVAFWLLYLGIGLAWQIVRGGRALEPLAGVFVITGGALAVYSCLFLIDEHVGLALLAVAALYALIATMFFRLEQYRDLASVLGAVAAVVAAVGTGELVTGISLTAVWAAVAVLLAWLARRTRERRLFLPAFAYAVLATGYALGVEAPPSALFDEVAHPGAGALAVVAAGVSLALFGHFSSAPARRQEESGAFGRTLDAGARAICAEPGVYFWAAGTLVLYSASLGVLELFGRVANHDWGHVALTGLWSLVGLALVVAGVRIGRNLDLGGLVLLVVTATEVAAYDSTLPDELGGTSALIVAAAGALAGLEFGRLSRFSLRLVPAGCAAVLSALFAIGGVEALAEGDWHGISAKGGALLLTAAVYGALALPDFRSHRDLSTIYWAIGLALATGAVTELVPDGWLVLTGAGGATVVALLGIRTREPRLELAGTAAFGLTTLYALAAQAPPSSLFTVAEHPAAGAPNILALVGAAALGALSLSRPELRLGAAWAAGGLGLYAASLGVLELFARISDFDWGHVALAGLWGAAAFALLEAGLRKDRLDLQIAAACLLGVAVLETVAYDWIELTATQAALASLLLASASLAGGVEYGRLARLRRRLLLAGAALGSSAILALVALVSLANGTWHGIDVEGGVLLAAGLVYGSLAAAVFKRERDLSTCLWAIGLGFAALGLVELVTGFWLVLAGAVGAVAIFLVGERLAEARLQLAGIVVYVSTLAYALGAEAPPRDFFVESAHPGSGVPALLVLAAAAGVLAWRPEALPHVRVAALAAAGAICFYAVSLSLLEIAELATDADIDTKFQRGHTAVSIFWGLVSLGFLYFGLTRRRRELRIAGFALFGVSLAKLFLYDLAFLSSLTRALSFITVGAVLLFAGFFYQRLSQQLEARDGPGRTA